jgi:tetratricopeptide (TPR) repeat protein
VPPILNHLNQQRERFRDSFKICFVFLLRAFSINYFLHRAPDFFDWRSGVFERPTTAEVLEQEISSLLLLEGDAGKYLKLPHEQKIEKVLEIQECLKAKHQKTHSRRERLLLELGYLLVATNEYEAALTYYDQALSIKQDYHEAWNNKGIALSNLKRYKEAIASYHQALKIKPDYHEAWYNQGNALYSLKFYEQAINSYNKAMEFKPDYAEALYYKEQALDKLGQHEKAKVSHDKVSTTTFHYSSGTLTDVTPVVVLKELVARLHREQNKIQDLLSSLAFALRNFNNLNQFLELIPLMATRVTDADGSALFLYKPNGQVRLEQLHWQDSRQRKNIRKVKH